MRKIIKLKFTVDNSGASFFAFVSYRIEKTKNLVKRLAVKRIIKSIFES